jgi:hypothetical protein
MPHEPFDTLRETLLKGGVAPRHVRRYLDELRDHLKDLIAQQQAQGYPPKEAFIRAHALLGRDEELAAAMLEQNQFRSLLARAPWAVFIPLPPLLALGASMLVFGAVAWLGQHHGYLAHNAASAPQWYKTLATIVAMALNISVMPLTAMLFVVAAARQRLKLVWPLAATLLLLLLFIHTDATFAPADPDRGVVLGFDPVFMKSAREVMLQHWPLVTAQYLLTLAPLLWLARRRVGRAS